MINGEPCVIQGPNSDVILHVPRGVHGAIIANIYTDNARFTRHIPTEDCLISPICEFHLQPFLYKSSLNVGRYKIHIPTIMKDVYGPNTVRHGSLYGGRLAKAKSQWLYGYDDQRGVVNCAIEGDHVIVYTSHLCGFIVTTESFNCCGRSANIHVFGSLCNWHSITHRPVGLVMVYFSSIHSNIKDYGFVRFPLIHSNEDYKHFHIKFQL